MLLLCLDIPTGNALQGLKNWQKLPPNELGLTVWILNHNATFHPNLVQIATAGAVTDRQAM